jgi:DNA-binding transcriptional LysR family regulator
MPKSRVNLLQARHLEAILAVADTGSVHAASRRLGVPQPALSRLLSAAEGTLGLKIFERSHAGTRVTEAGRRVVRQSAFAVRALQTVNEAARESLPLFRVGCIPRVMHTLVPHLLTMINDRKAGFTAQIYVGTSQELTADLNASRFDFVIGRQAVWPSSVELTEDASTIESERLYEEQTVIACGHENKSNPASVRSPLDLADAQWVLAKPGYYSRDALDRMVAGCSRDSAEFRGFGCRPDFD